MISKIKGITGKAVLLYSVLILSFFQLNAEGDKYFSFEDVMHFKALRGEKVSDDGRWVSYYTRPDRGDTKAYIQATTNDSIKYEINRGAAAQISTNGEWAAVTVLPDAVDLANKKGKDRPKSGMAIVRTNDGNTTEIPNVAKYKFSNDSKWLIYKLSGDEKPDKKFKERPVGSDMVLRHLESGAELTFNNVNDFAIDSLSRYLAFVVADKDAVKNGIYFISLESDLKFPMAADTGGHRYFSNLEWNHKKNLLAYVAAKEGNEGRPDSCSVRFWNPLTNNMKVVINDNTVPKDWFVPFKNKISWTDDGARLYFGIKPFSDTALTADEKDYTDSTYFDINAIKNKAEVDVWHWKDPLIKPNRKKWWSENKDRVFTCVYHLNLDKWVQLADKNLPIVPSVDNPRFAIGLDNTPYLREITWESWYSDLYKIDIITGEKKLVKKKVQYDNRISPLGNFIVYFFEKNWYLYDCNTDSTKNLTADMDNPFYNEEWDQPISPPSYGFGGWLENDEAVLLYDRYDIWKFYTREGTYLNQTAADGRLNKVRFRLLHVDPDKKFYKRNDYAFVSGFSEIHKNSGLFKTNFYILGLVKLVFDQNMFRLYGRAKNANEILFSFEKYNRFPDLWVADTNMKGAKQITDINPQMKDYNWGTTQLVNWVSYDGDSLQGFIIKPDNFDPKKRYPVLIYFYEKMSDRMYAFEQPGNNHRPCFPTYVSDGYVIFLPDIKFKEGNPGRSSLDALLSGSRKLVEMGIADSTRIGLWGHSWSGYQAAYIITQTNFFKCAVAGAPVGNMTSAYGGIRRGSGLARQFQYEEWQSRIGGTLWDSLDAYIRNSPVFFADKVQTPLLMEFGDKDDAVPWEQGIELYLDLRRLNKNVILLEYRNEPHHPHKYFNKLDYAIKMKQFYDHYLKGKPAPEWMVKGVEYRGK